MCEERGEFMGHKLVELLACFAGRGHTDFSPRLQDATLDGSAAALDHGNAGPLRDRDPAIAAHQDGEGGQLQRA